MGHQVQVIAGAAATARLGDTGFLQAWEALADACPWTTIFQRPAYARAWFGVYGPTQEPLFLLAQDPAGDLVGLLLLARDRSDDTVAPVGRHQAEYQGWLATPSHAATFPAAALRALRTAVPTLAALRLHYLPPAMDEGWIPAVQAGGLFVDHRRHRRGLMRLGPEGSVEASLRKSANRSRLARLKRLGAISFTQLTTREALEPLIDDIALHCDLRHGAQHDILPFTEDPAKRAFLLALMETPGLGHATVLRAGETLLAAHVSVADPQAVPLGIITYDPTLAVHSPGKLHLLLLGRHLAAEGYARFDLTPGEDPYKERFASDFDEVSSVTIWLRRSGAVTDRVRRFGRRALGAMAKMVTRRSEPLHHLLHRVAFGSARSGVRRTLLVESAALPGRVVKWWGSSQQFVYYGQQLAAEHATLPRDRFRINALRDLLCYQPMAPLDISRQAFLQAALVRLEAGCLVFTRVEHGRLVHHGWLDPRATHIGSDLGHHFDVADHPAVLWDDYTAPDARGRGLHQESIRARLSYAATDTSARYAMISVLADNVPSIRNVERAGFARIGSAWRTITRGTSHRRTTWTRPLQPVGEGGPLAWQVETVRTESDGEAP